VHHHHATGGEPGMSDDRFMDDLLRTREGEMSIDEFWASRLQAMDDQVTPQQKAEIRRVIADYTREHPGAGVSYGPFDRAGVNVLLSWWDEKVTQFENRMWCVKADGTSVEVEL
jgi:hypothetical protein